MKALGSDPSTAKKERKVRGKKEGEEEGGQAGREGGNAELRPGRCDSWTLLLLKEKGRPSVWPEVTPRGPHAEAGRALGAHLLSQTPAPSLADSRLRGHGACTGLPRWAPLLLRRKCAPHLPHCPGLLQPGQEGGRLPPSFLAPARTKDSAVPRKGCGMHLLCHRKQLLSQEAEDKAKGGQGARAQPPRQTMGPVPHTL